jgi:hypothetical protein
MNIKRLILALAVVSPLAVQAQDKIFTPGGFIRGGAYFSTGDYIHNVNAAFGDAALTLNAADNKSFTGFADIRLRAGQQFGENVNTVTLREAWAMYYNSFMSVSAGKKIIKWGRSDIFTPLSKFNPTDFTFRSPDHEDGDLGNILGELTFTPAPFMRLSAVATPFWNPSILITKPLVLPSSITLEMPEGLQTGNGYYSWGVRGDFTLKAFDAGIQYYHGPDLFPGMSLAGADYTDPFNPLITIRGVPYIISNAGLDFETVISPFVVRGTLSYNRPAEVKQGHEEIPFPQVEWVAGFDWTPGAVRLTAEYSGKKVLDFYESPYAPIIGTEPDMAKLAELFSTPGFDPVEFTRLEVEAFNRLYNNQMYEYYHSAGLQLETDLLYGKLIPSLTGVYNFTSHDLLLMPVLKYKPADGVTFSAGMEFYSGKKGGLYDIIDDFMNAAFLSLKIEF